MLSITITVFTSNKIIISVDHPRCGNCVLKSFPALHPSLLKFLLKSLCSLQHNVFKFLEGEIMVDGGDDSAQDIHQPSNRMCISGKNYNQYLLVVFK